MVFPKHINNWNQLKYIYIYLILKILNWILLLKAIILYLYVLHVIFNHLYWLKFFDYLLPYLDGTMN